MCWLKARKIRRYPPFLSAPIQTNNDAFLSACADDLAVKLLNADDFVSVISMGDTNEKILADNALGFLIVKVRFPVL